MKTIVILVLLAIVAVSAWIGYKNKAIRGVFAVLTIIVSIYGASVISSAYADEFSGILKPFVGGVVDSAVSDVVNEPKDAVIVHPLTAAEKRDVYSVSYSALRQVGVAPTAAELIAEEERGKFDEVNLKMNTGLSEALCETITHAVVFEICFILIAIVFAVIGNLADFIFKIPAIGKVDQVLGAVFGAAQGVIIILALLVVFRYAGIIIPAEIESIEFLTNLIDSNPVARMVGM